MMTDSKKTKGEILLVYDMECPACDNYCRLVCGRGSVGDLHLVDARVPSEIMNEITRAGLDIDQGMALKIDEVLYYGADAIHALALMSNPSGLFNHLNYWIFRSKSRSRILYPVLRFFRNLLLKLLDKPKINNLRFENNDRF